MIRNTAVASQLNKIAISLPKGADRKLGTSGRFLGNPAKNLTMLK